MSPPRPTGIAVHRGVFARIARVRTSPPRVPTAQSS